MLRKLNHPFFEAPAGGGGAANDEAAKMRDQIRAELRKELEQEVAGLKSNRDAILAEKRQMKEQLESVMAQLNGVGGAEGIKALQQLQARLEKDESTKLVAEGKWEEVLDRRTASMRSEHGQQIKSLTEQLETATSRVAAAERARTDLLLETEVRASAGKLGVVESAVSDVILRAKGVFSFDPERTALVIKDKDGGAIFGKDGKTPMTVGEWLEGQKESARHWFPPSKGAGAAGAHGGGSAGEPDIAKMSREEYVEWRKKKGMDRRGSPLLG